MDLPTPASPIGPSFTFNTVPSTIRVCSDYIINYLSFSGNGNRDFSSITTVAWSLFSHTPTSPTPIVTGINTILTSLNTANNKNLSINK